MASAAGLPAAAPSRPRLRILCLHSFRTSGRIFQEQLQRAGLDRQLADLVELTFIDAPNAASGPIPDDVAPFFSGPYFEWWNANRDAEGRWSYEGWQRSVKAIERAIAEQGGPRGFDGLMGFSQGGAITSLAIGMQRSGFALKDAPPLRFCVCFAGIRVRDPQLECFYSALRPCPSLHIIGDKDPVKRLTNLLIDSFERPVVINHTRGHVIPALAEPDLHRLRSFLQEQQEAVAAAQQQADGAMADLEEGEIEEGELEGELGPVPGAPAVAEESPPPPPPPAKRTPPKEQLLAPRHDGRAPYFADPLDGYGWCGRLPAGRGKKKKKKSGAGFVDVYGQGACAEIEVYSEQGPIRVADAQNLVLWVLGDGTNPRWCFIKNKPLVKKVVLLAAHGLDSALWESPAGQAALPTWRRCLGEPIELQARNATLAPGSTVHNLLTVPQTKKRRREEAAGQPSPATTAATGAAAAPVPANGSAAEAAAGPDLHDAAHGAASPGEAAMVANGAATPASGAASGPAAAAAAAAAAEAAADTPAPAAPAAKRMKVASSDDVSSRVQPQLAAAAGGAAAGTAPNGAAATPAGAATATPPAVAAPASGPGAHRRCELPPSHYVLTLEQLQEHSYPLPQLDEASGEMVCPPGFVATQSCGGAPAHDLVAVDCEMCVTAEGFELTRATLVDRHGKVLLDELVVPRNPITDHNTRYSGITAEMLEGVTTRLEDVQEQLRQLVAAETLLVAHSGENDLAALKLIHANVIDTSVLFPHPRGPPFKSALRVLASRHLLRTIQQGEHNPVEDARAAMDLALLKFERGPAYAAGGGERGDKLAEVLNDAGRRSTLIDRLELLNRQVVGNCSAIVAEGDAAVVAQLVKEAAKAQVDFVWGQLTALQQFYEARLAAARESGEPEPSSLYRLEYDGSSGEQQGQPAGQQSKQQQQAAEQQGSGEAPPPPPLPPAEQPEQHQQQQADGDASSDSPQQGTAQPPAAAAQVGTLAQRDAALRSLDRSLGQVWEAAAPGTLLLVVTGQGDTSYSRYLQEQKWRRQQGLDHGQPSWSPECEAHLAAVQARALSALCFAAVKPAAA